MRNQWVRDYDPTTFSVVTLPVAYSRFGWLSGEPSSSPFSSSLPHHHNIAVSQVPSGSSVTVVTGLPLFIRLSFSAGHRTSAPSHTASPVPEPRRSGDEVLDRDLIKLNKRPSAVLSAIRRLRVSYYFISTLNFSLRYGRLAALSLLAL
jgi:hypothetical protein